MSDSNTPLPAPPSIEVKALSYAFQDGSSGLKDVHLDLPAHSRTLLIGGMQKPTFTAPRSETKLLTDSKQMARARQPC